MHIVEKSATVILADGAEVRERCVIEGERGFIAWCEGRAVRLCRTSAGEWREVADGPAAGRA